MNISLEGSIRTCKVDSGWASRLESDRFMNPNMMLCPSWNHVDTSGRTVHSNTFYTKRGGCNSAADRVDVENSLRPKYMEYVTLDAQGIQGSDCPQMQGQINVDSKCGRKTLDAVHKQTG
jgi:hypothetical protein